jgi:lysozyme family protein
MLIWLYLLEKIIPVARSVKNIESSNVAYYQAQSAVENALFQINPLSPMSSDFNTGVVISSGLSWSGTIHASWRWIPQPGQGNSEYDSTKSWNRLAIWQPIQLKLPTNIDWSVAKFYFRVPDLNGDGIWNESLSWSNTPYISWILTWSGDSLYAVDAAQVLGGGIDWSSISLEGDLWTKLDNLSKLFSVFYAENCKDIELKCSLKLWVINPLVLADSTTVPYLEYQIDFWQGKSVPQQYAVITADGYASGFKQTIQRQAEQITTNEALDFTIFQ